MNQSNKALREAAIRKLRNADHAKCYEPAWHRDTADILIALVTNHIKGKMPEPTQILVQVSDNEYLNGGYVSHAEVSQILKEMEE